TSTGKGVSPYGPDRDREILQYHQGLRLHYAGRRRQGRVRPHLRRRGVGPAHARRWPEGHLRRRARPHGQGPEGGQPARRLTAASGSSLLGRCGRPRRPFSLGGTPPARRLSPSPVMKLSLAPTSKIGEKALFG